MFNDLFKVILDVLLSYFRTIELNVSIYIQMYDSVNPCTATQHLRHSFAMELKEFVIFQLVKYIHNLFLLLINIINGKC